MIALAGCSSTPTTPTSPATTSPEATTQPTTSAPTAEPTPTPSADDALATSSIEIGTESLTLQGKDGADLKSYNYLSDGVALTTDLSALFGTVEPTAGSMDVMSMQWKAFAVNYRTATPENVWVIIKISALDGVPFKTAEGIQVGGTEDEVIAAGGTLAITDPATGTKTYELQPVEVPGTTSLVDNSQVGSKFISVFVEDGVVTSIIAPADNYSDI